MNNFKKILYSIGCCAATVIVAETFVKTTPKKIPTLSTESCVEDALQEGTALATILESVGASLSSIGGIMKRKATFTQEVIDADRQGTIKRANNIQRHDYVVAQRKFDMHLESLEKRLQEDLVSLARLVSDYERYLANFEKEVKAEKQKTA